MKFGPVPLAKAEGTILAHSLALPDGKLAKGKRLGPEDIERLSAAGHVEVTAAEIEPGDLDEDRSALRLAEALVSPGCGLLLGSAATGRVNVRAEGPGVVMLDEQAIHALNRVNPGITVATVPPWHRLAARGLAATIKIIPYAVPETDVARAADAGRGALSFRQPHWREATLIETQIGAGVPSPKGRRATEERLDRLGVALAERVIVPHEAPAIAEAVRAAKGLCLILTGSATSDGQDTAPQGVRLAGGHVIHYGMPVDPGNLLFVGAHAARPVIGLPGCARSPALNGADWVLERLVCGVPVGPEDIAVMGVGGLLKEIPTRPLPRREVDGDAG